MLEAWGVFFFSRKKLRSTLGARKPSQGSSFTCIFILICFRNMIHACGACFLFNCRCFRVFQVSAQKLPSSVHGPPSDSCIIDQLSGNCQKSPSSNQAPPGVAGSVCLFYAFEQRFGCANILKLFYAVLLRDC